MLTVATKNQSGIANRNACPWCSPSLRKVLQMLDDRLYLIGSCLDEGGSLNADRVIKISVNLVRFRPAFKRHG